MCVCGRKRGLCVKSARDSSLTDICLLLSADTTHGNQRKTSLTRVCSSHFNTGERKYGLRTRPARSLQLSHDHIRAWEEGRSSNSTTKPPLPSTPLHCSPTGSVLWGAGWGCGRERSPIMPKEGWTCANTQGWCLEPFQIPGS